MKKIIEKFSCHGKKSVHFSLFVPIVVLALVGFVDWPLFSLAEELKMEIPIVHTYKIKAVEETTAPAPTVEPAPAATTAPAVEEKSTIVTPVPVVEPVKEEVRPVETAPAPAVESTTAVSQPAPEQQEQFVEEKEEMEFVDPREVKNALRDIKRMQGDLKRFMKQMKKLPNSADDIAAMNALLAQLAEHYKLISKPPADMSLREALQEYWDARLWEEVDQFRAKVEIPKELKNIEKDLKRLKKLVVLKPFKNLGFDMNALAQNISEIETAYNETKINYAQGNMEDAWSALEVIHSGMNPGEVMGVLYQTREIKDKLKAIKNKDLKEAIEDLLADVIESANNGDFREANHVLSDIRNELLKIMNQFMKKPMPFDDKTRAKLEKLEEIVQSKLNVEKPEAVKGQEEVK